MRQPLESATTGLPLGIFFGWMAKLMSLFAIVGVYISVQACGIYLYPIDKIDFMQLLILVLTNSLLYAFLDELVKLSMLLAFDDKYAPSSTP